MINKQQADFNLAHHDGWFHDGSLNGIEHNGTDLRLMVNSCEIVDEPELRRMLSEERTLDGILWLKDVSKIVVDDKPFHYKLTMLYEDSEILDFELEAKQLLLGLYWLSWTPKFKIEDYSQILIHFEQAVWISKGWSYPVEA